MEQTNQNLMLGEEKISKLLLKFSIPCILSLLISALYNIVDQIFVGNSELGYLGNAATGIVFPILIIAQAFAWCIGDGSAAYLSICQGKKDTGNAHRCVGTGITITLILSVILLVLCAVWKEPLLRLFGASDQTIGMAMEYFTIVLCFFPVFMLMNMMNAVIRADGSPAISMASMSLGAILNIILDPVFIFVLNWGIAGAAWATVIGQTISFLVSALYFFRTKSFRLTKESFVPHFKIFSNALKLGASSFITQMSIVVISLACNIMLAKYGALSIYGQDIPISVISIETKVFTIVINIVVGIVLGGQPILGYNYGAKKYNRVKETYRTILIATLVVGVVSTLVFELCPQVIINIFGSGNDALYLEYAQRTFRIFLSLVIFTCVIKMSSIFFQAVGKPVMAVIASLTRDIVCFVPLVLLIPSIAERNQAGSGINGILFAAIVLAEKPLPSRCCFPRPVRDEFQQHGGVEHPAFLLKLHRPAIPGGNLPDGGGPDSHALPFGGKRRIPFKDHRRHAWIVHQNQKRGAAPPLHPELDGLRLSRLPLAGFHRVFQQVPQQHRDVCPRHRAAFRIVNSRLKLNAVIPRQGHVIADDGVHHVVAAVPLPRVRAREVSSTFSTTWEM